MKLNPVDSLNNRRQPSRLGLWLARHEVVAFYILVFFFTGLVMGLLAAFPPENPAAFSRIVLISSYAPALAALFLVPRALTAPGIRFSIWRLPLVLVIVLLTAAVEWLDHLWWNHRIDVPLILADIVLVAFASLTLTRLLDGSTGIRIWPARKSSWQIWLWVVVALALWPVLILAGNQIAGWIGITIPPAIWPVVPFPLILIEGFIWAFLFGGALNEEPGWRGFALPRLQSRFTPLVASLIVGVLWGLWHVPNHLVGVYGGGAFGALIRVMDIPRAVLFTWVYNRCKGQLWIVLLLHASTNTTSYFLNRSWEVTLVLTTLAAVVVIFTDKMWRRLTPQGDS